MTIHIYLEGNPEPAMLMYDGSDDSSLGCSKSSTAWPTYQHDSRHSGQSSNLGPQSSDSRLVYDLGVGNSVTSPVVGPNGWIYFTKAPVNGFSWNLLAIRHDGSTSFDVGPFDGHGGSSTIASDGTIYADASTGGPDSHFYAFNSNGSVKWSKDLPGFSGRVTLGSDDTYISLKDFGKIIARTIFMRFIPTVAPSGLTIMAASTALLSRQSLPMAKINYRDNFWRI